MNGEICWHNFLKTAGAELSLLASMCTGTAQYRCSTLSGHGFQDLVANNASSAFVFEWDEALYAIKWSVHLCCNKEATSRSFVPFLICRESWGSGRGPGPDVLTMSFDVEWEWTCRGMAHRDSEHSIYSDYTMAIAAEGGEGDLQLLTEENKKMHVYVNFFFFTRDSYGPSVKEDRTLRKLSRWGSNGASEFLQRPPA